MRTDLPPELQEQLSKMASPAHLAQYVTRDMPSDTKWKPYKHLLYINRLLVDALTDPHDRFLNVAASVRMGKSRLISEYMPVWYLGLYPDRQVIIVSYNESKAGDWGEATRNVMQQYGPELFGVTVDSGSASKTNWGVKGRRGGLRAVGVGGSLSGLGGDAIIIDDPLKNREEANSKAGQENMWSWYGSTLRSRLMPGGTLILTMARWHENDLTGMIEHRASEDSDQWQKVLLPALAETPKGEDPETWTDALGRHEGDALWPELWPRERLLRTKASIAPVDWQSLYMQNPTPPEGGMFKVESWQRRPYVERSGLRMARVWDLAATEGGGDWTSGVLMGMDPHDKVYVPDVQRFQKDSAGVQAQVKATAEADGKLIPIRIEQERAGAGKAQIADYKRLLLGWDVDGVKPEGTKEQRAAPYATQQQNSNVYLLDGPWNEQFIEEHRVFPKGRFDDQVDAAAGAFNFLAGGGVSVIVGEEIREIPLERMWLQGRAMSTP